MKAVLLCYFVAAAAFSWSQMDGFERGYVVAAGVLLAAGYAALERSARRRR